MFAKRVVFLVLFVFISVYAREIDNKNKFGDFPIFKSNPDYVEYYLCKIRVIQSGTENSCLETAVCVSQNGQDSFPNLAKITFKPNPDFATKETPMKTKSDEEKRYDFDEDFYEDYFDEDFDEDYFDEDDFDEDFDIDEFYDFVFDEKDFFHEPKNDLFYEDLQDFDEDDRNEVIPHSFPYQVAIIGENDFLDNDDNDDDEGEDSNDKENKEVEYDNDNEVFCGGSLISKNFVLTAAHCVYEKSLATMIFGAHNLLALETSKEFRHSSTFIIHEEWSPQTYANDIALIELPFPIVLNEYITTVGLPDFSDVDELFVGEAVTIAGWGKNFEDGALQYVEYKIISNRICKTYLPLIKPTNICTSRDSLFCSGDSGSPLVARNKQIGILSFSSNSGCNFGWPAGFTRITSYLDWISKNSDVFLT